MISKAIHLTSLLFWVRQNAPSATSQKISRGTRMHTNATMQKSYSCETFLKMRPPLLRWRRYVVNCRLFHSLTNYAILIDGE